MRTFDTRRTKIEICNGTATKRMFGNNNGYRQQYERMPGDEPKPKRTGQVFGTLNAGFVPMTMSQRKFNGSRHRAPRLRFLGRSLPVSHFTKKPKNGNGKKAATSRPQPQFKLLEDTYKNGIRVRKFGNVKMIQASPNAGSTPAS